MYPFNVVSKGEELHTVVIMEIILIFFFRALCFLKKQIVFRLRWYLQEALCKY